MDPRRQQGEASPFTALRRQQGWRATIAAGTRQQLAEVHAEGPTVVSITCPATNVSAYDNAGTWLVETRVGEALRVRRFASRACGVCVNVPAGVTRVFSSADFLKDLPVLVQAAPGIAASEVWTEYLELPAGGTATAAPPPFARECEIIAQQADARVTVPYGQTYIYAHTGAAGRWDRTTVPGVNLSIDNATLGQAVVALRWTIFA